jgi:hypothetical protein
MPAKERTSKDEDSIETSGEEPTVTTAEVPPESQAATPVTPERIVVIKDKKSADTDKKVGREPYMGKDPDKVRLYKAEKKELMLMEASGNPHRIIKFVNYEYRTDNAEDIKYIESHGLFNKGIWRDKFPPDVVRKFKIEKSYTTRDVTTFMPPEK